MGGLGWWFGILRVPLSNNPCHKRIPNIQTTNLPLVELIMIFTDFGEIFQKLKELVALHPQAKVTEETTDRKAAVQVRRVAE